MDKEDLIKELKKLGWSMPNLVLQAKIVGFPIMWFGDYDSYISSKKRIVTIAINPSDVEFKENRFVKYDPNNHSDTSYIGALNEYFKNKPYTQWFKHYEVALNGMDASYGGKMSVGNYSNTALHIDYDAPIATAPTWANLLNNDRKKLHDHYSGFFGNLVSFLNPDVILVSLATEKLTSIVNELNFKHVETLLKSNLSDLAVSKIYNSDGGKRILIAGRNYGTPMSSLTKSERQSICNHAVNGGKLPNNITSSNNDYPKIGTCLSQSSHKKPCIKSINYPNSAVKYYLNQDVKGYSISRLVEVIIRDYLSKVNYTSPSEAVSILERDLFIFSRKVLSLTQTPGTIPIPCNGGEFFLKRGAWGNVNNSAAAESSPTRRFLRHLEENPHLGYKVNWKY